MKTNNPAVLLPNKTFSGVRETKSSSILMDPYVDNTSPYEIDAEVLQNLPLFYRKAAAVFAASGKIKIIDTRAGGSAYE